MRERVVVTGASSFVGMHLALFLQRSGYEVFATLSQKSSNYSGIQAQRLKKLQQAKINLEQLELTDNSEIKSFIASIKPSYWIQHAGWAQDYSSFDYDIEQGFAINVQPLRAIYENLAAINSKGVVITGSGAEYKDSTVASLEEDSCIPSFPYGLSKLAATLFASQLTTYYKLPARVARIFIPYGPLDNPAKLLPTVINSLKNSQSIALTVCKQKRDFIYINDLVLGYNALLNDLTVRGGFDIFNLCSGVATSLKELLQKIASYYEEGEANNLLQFGTLPMRAGETQIAYGSNKKAATILKWNPHTLDFGLQDYLQQLRNYDD